MHVENNLCCCYCVVFKCHFHHCCFPFHSHTVFHYTHSLCMSLCLSSSFLLGSYYCKLVTILNILSRSLLFWPCSVYLTRRDPRVPWSVFPRQQRACSYQAVSLEAEWLQRSSWSGWSATTGRWCANVRGTSATENVSPPPTWPPSAPPPPPGCPPAPLILHPLYVTPHPRAAAAAAGTGSTTFTTTAATPHSSPQLLNNLARMLTH